MSASAFSMSNWKTRSTNEDLSTLDLLDEELFLKVLQIEQKRTERSGRRFVLLLLRCENLLTCSNTRKPLESILDTLSTSIRATDTTGWYKRGSVIGIIFTELGAAEGKTITHALLTKVTAALSNSLSIEQINQISVSFHVFPEDWDVDNVNRGDGKRLPDDPTETRIPRKASMAAKRLIDITGSLSALVVLAPIMAAIAAAVKLSSKGPILFKQQRVGRYGRNFSFWKFRSMQCNNNTAIHEEFVKTLIAGQNGAAAQPGNTQKSFKIKNDPRVTPIGRFLRRTSLDELPQLFNVLIGDMSLVGPRPPIPYEVKYYDIWHRRRLLAAKPGITGLWQVNGRSRVGFDDMVRLDLKYATSWSLWLDFKILLQTPRAVLGGEGAC